MRQQPIQCRSRGLRVRETEKTTTPAGSDLPLRPFRLSDGAAESAAATMTINVTAVNDDPTGAPVITGAARVRQTQSASRTGIGDVDGLSANESDYAYQWVRVDGGTSTDITGATSRTYEVAAADEGKKLKVEVSYTDDGGTPEEVASAEMAMVGTNTAPVAANSAVETAEDTSYTFRNGAASSRRGEHRHGKIQGFLDRPLEGDWPYLWLDATYVKVREAGRIVSVAVTVAVAVNDQGRREVLGMAVGASEAETFWTEFLRGLARRGLRGVKLVIADDHKGLKAAVTRILSATTQRCRVHFMRNLLAHAGKQGRRVVSAFVATAFAQEDAEAASAQWRLVADQLRPKAPKLAALMDEAEHDVLAYVMLGWMSGRSAGAAERRSLISSWRASSSRSRSTMPRT